MAGGYTTWLCSLANTNIIIIWAIDVYQYTHILGELRLIVSRPTSCMCAVHCAHAKTTKFPTITSCIALAQIANSNVLAAIVSVYIYYVGCMLTAVIVYIQILWMRYSLSKSYTNLTLYCFYWHNYVQCIIPCSCPTCPIPFIALSETCTRLDPLLENDFYRPGYK